MSFTYLTAWALAIWLMVLYARVITSFVNTDRPWVRRTYNAANVRPGRRYALRCVLNRAGCFLSIANPVLEPLRPAIRGVHRFAMEFTEGVLRPVRHLPVKMSITPHRRKDAPKRTFRDRLANADRPTRAGFVLDFGPGLVLLLGYLLVLPMLSFQYGPHRLVAALLWVVFCVALVAEQVAADDGDRPDPQPTPVGVI